LVHKAKKLVEQRITSSKRRNKKYNELTPVKGGDLQKRELYKKELKNPNNKKKIPLKKRGKKRQAMSTTLPNKQQQKTRFETSTWFIKNW